MDDRKEKVNTSNQKSVINNVMSSSLLLTSFDAVATPGTACGTVGAPSPGDGWYDTGVGGIATDPARLSVACSH